MKGIFVEVCLAGFLGEAVFALPSNCTTRLLM